MILVTGATGFIGWHLTERLLQEGATVRVVTRDLGRVPIPWAGRVEVITGSLLNQGVREQATREVSLIYHLAGETRDKAAMRAVNVEAVRGLLETAESAGVKRLVHLSSAGVIGADPPGVFTEASPCRPQNVYEQTKLDGERAVITVAQSDRIEAVVVRPTIVFGENRPHVGDSFLDWLRAVQKRRFVFIGSKAVANYVYVGDVVEVLLQLAQKPPSRDPVFIVADPAPMRDFVSAMAQALGVPAPTRSVPVWAAYAIGAGLQTANQLFRTPAPLTLRRVRALSSQCLFSGDRLRKEVGLLLPFGYRAGLLQTVRWYREVGWL